MMNRVPGIVGGVAVVETGRETAMDPDLRRRTRVTLATLSISHRTCLEWDSALSLYISCNFNVAMSGLANTGVTDYEQDPKKTASQITASRVRSENVSGHSMAVVVGLTNFKKRAGDFPGAGVPVCRSAISRGSSRSIYWLGHFPHALATFKRQT